jgi:hypothetical protein
MDFAKINDWLYVGNYRACGTPIVEACVHINRSDHPECDCGRHRYPVQIELDYRDGDILLENHLGLLAHFIASLRASKRPTLVHCRAGTCRSPTVGAYILAMVDGLHPMDAFAKVERACYDAREGREACNFVYRPKIQIAQLVEKSQRQGY